MKVTVQNLTTSLLSTDVGLLQPAESKSVFMGPTAAYKAAEGLKSLVDAGRASVSVVEEPTKLNAMEPALLGQGGLDFVDVVVSSAQILALNATPVTLVATPGAGKALLFEGATLFLDYNSAAYAGIAAGEDLSIKYTDGSGTAVGGCEATGFMDATADATRYVQAYRAASGVSDITPTANAPLVLNMLTGEIITGNSPLKCRVFYRVLNTDLSSLS